MLSISFIDKIGLVIAFYRPRSTHRFHVDKLLSEGYPWFVGGLRRRGLEAFHFKLTLFTHAISVLFVITHCRDVILGVAIFSCAVY